MSGYFWCQKCGGTFDPRHTYCPNCDGGLVADLRAEVSRLTSERDELLGARELNRCSIKNLQQEKEQLRAEVSRLTAELAEANAAKARLNRNWCEEQQMRDAAETELAELYARPIPAAQAVPVEFLLDGARFKLSFQPIHCEECGAEHDKVAVEPLGMYANELDGKWIALVPAENDRHLKMKSAQAVPDGDALLFAAEAQCNHDCNQGLNCTCRGEK